MILKDSGEVVSDSGEDGMPELEDVSDGDVVEYPVEGEVLVLMRVLNAQIKVVGEEPGQ